MILGTAKNTCKRMAAKESEIDEVDFARRGLALFIKRESGDSLEIEAVEDAELDKILPKAGISSQLLKHRFHWAVHPPVSEDKRSAHTPNLNTLSSPRQE